MAWSTAQLDESGQPALTAIISDIKNILQPQAGDGRAQTVPTQSFSNSRRTHLVHNDPRRWDRCYRHSRNGLYYHLRGQRQ
jgi:hypothetical protein